MLSFREADSALTGRGVPGSRAEAQSAVTVTSAELVRVKLTPGGNGDPRPLPCAALAWVATPCARRLGSSARARFVPYGMRRLSRLYVVLYAQAAAALPAGRMKV
jgi:hypothetical protein